MAEAPPPQSDFNDLLVPAGVSEAPGVAGGAVTGPQPGPRKKKRCRSKAV